MDIDLYGVGEIRIKKSMLNKATERIQIIITTSELAIDKGQVKVNHVITLFSEQDKKIKVKSD